MSVTLRALWIIARRAVVWTVKGLARAPFVFYIAARHEKEHWPSSMDLSFAAVLLGSTGAFVGLLGVLCSYSVQSSPGVAPAWIAPVCVFVLAQMMAALILPDISKRVSERWRSVVKEAEEQVRLKNEASAERDVLLRPSEQNAEPERLVRPCM